MSSRKLGELEKEAFHARARWVNRTLVKALQASAGSVACLGKATVFCGVRIKPASTGPDICEQIELAGHPDDGGPRLPLRAGIRVFTEFREALKMSCLPPEPDATTVLCYGSTLTLDETLNEWAIEEAIQEPAHA